MDLKALGDKEIIEYGVQLVVSRELWWQGTMITFHIRRVQSSMGDILGQEVFILQYVAQHSVQQRQILEVSRPVGKV